jgi:Ca2+-binding RTX toxin-like protein
MSDVDASLVNGDLTLNIKGGTDADSVLVKGFGSVVASDRLRVDFAAGGSWDAATIDRMVTATNDALTGTAGSEVLNGGLGNDTITAQAGDDTLYGEAGNDTLDGGDGADMYVFGRGDGVEWVHGVFPWGDIGK